MTLYDNTQKWNNLMKNDISIKYEHKREEIIFTLPRCPKGEYTYIETKGDSFVIEGCDEIKFKKVIVSNSLIRIIEE